MDIKKILLTERTLSSLKAVTSANFGGGRDSRANQVQISNIKYIPSMQQGILVIECLTQSNPSKRKYNTVVKLSEVEYIDDSRYNFLQKAEERDSQNYNTYTFNAGGQQYYVSYDRKKSLDVEVSCSCEDFRWRFATYNQKDGSLYGNPPPNYVSKTDRPPVNPNNTPGVCKHLIKLKKELETEEFFRELFN